MKKLLSILACLAITGHALADELNVVDISIKPGENKVVSVELLNPEHIYTLLEFTLTLPEGIGIAKDEDGEWAAELNASRFHDTHTLEVEEIGEHVYKFLVYSGLNKATKGTSGEIISLTLAADADAPIGQKQGIFSEQLFVDPDKNGYNPDDKTFNIKIGGVLGDADGNGEVEIADALAVVNYILTNGNPTGDFVFETANIVDDEVISIADAVAIVNIILNGGLSE